jgi:hypothetical protein
MDPKVIRETATIGTPPPPGAPDEVSQPLDMNAQLAEMRRVQAINESRGRGAEGQLQPFNPQPGPAPEQPEVASRQLEVAHAQQTVASPQPSVEPNAAEKLLEAVRATQGERSHQPAASDSDSPSRGIPRPITDPGKVITGGFGNIGEAQYYAITGLELASLVRGLMDKLNARMENDLRFCIGLTYPKIAVRLWLEVESYAQNEGINIEYVKVPEKQTPVEIAKQHGDKVVFVLVEKKQEFDESGEPVDAPDRMREEMGLQVPRKQIVESGAGRQVVDVVPDIAESF